MAVLDTNQLLDNLESVDKMIKLDQVNVVLPARVLSELELIGGGAAKSLKGGSQLVDRYLRSAPSKKDQEGRQEGTAADEAGPESTATLTETEQEQDHSLTC